MTVIGSLHDAIEELVHDGDTIALEGFTHLIPVAAGHEIIRQGRRDLTVIRMTPDIVYDQLIGAGCVRKLIFSWGGNPGVGSLHRFRDAVEHGWPRPLEIEEHSHAGMANRYVAGASGLPFAVMRGYRGTDLVAQTETLAPITCPFTGEELTAVPAINPDVTIIHAQQADRAGNVMLWGIVGIQKEALLAARRALVTVEEVVDELEPRPGSVVIPSWAVSHVAEVPGGAHPSYAQGYSTRDNDYYRAWDAISADRDRFTAVARPSTSTPCRGAVMTARVHARRRDDDRRRPLPRRRRGVLRRHRPAVDRGQPRPPHPRPEPRARVRVGHARLQAGASPAVDRRRRAGRHRRQRDQRAGGLQLLVAAGTHRRRVPRRRPDRPVRQHQLDRHR